ncbi:hypothetical protein BPA30113_06938 [Burkholderia paludis]|uniref:Uncharacterized protein n=1 Tax=Burkholderia paludis TaxID=1506587 RepID=A0A6P2RWE7_9BURK|nr:hypothetical protein LMG30113_06417 [Burkholderia paludis]VWC41292.1 hypothetical protein BPA30113_06938 [Burkholderia paludis]
MRSAGRCGSRGRGGVRRRGELTGAGIGGGNASGCRATVAGCIDEMPGAAS